MAQHDQKDDQGSTAKNFDYNNLRILKRTTKGQRPRPREPRVWSTSQQSPPSLWSALNKVIMIIFISITITTAIIREAVMREKCSFFEHCSKGL